MLGVRKIKVAFRRFARMQKRNLMYRVINPARYGFDLVRFRLASAHAVQNSSTRPIRVALISDLDASGSEHQLDPFSTYRSKLRQELRLISLHFVLRDVLRAPKLLLTHFDVIILKMSFRTSLSNALHVVRTIRSSLKSNHLIYFDGDDDLCIQWPRFSRPSTCTSRNIYLATS